MGNAWVATMADDNAVCAAVEAGARHFADIRVAVAERGHAMEYRQLDRALQRTRKAGRLRYVTGSGWTVPHGLRTVRHARQ